MKGRSNFVLGMLFEKSIDLLHGDGWILLLQLLLHQILLKDIHHMRFTFVIKIIFVVHAWDTDFLKGWFNVIDLFAIKNLDLSSRHFFKHFDEVLIVELAFEDLFSLFDIEQSLNCIKCLNSLQLSVFTVDINQFL